MVLQATPQSQELDPVASFYCSQLAVNPSEQLVADCPFCANRGFSPGRLQVHLKRGSLFNGYFRCSNRCVPPGFLLWFARLAGLDLSELPGYLPENPTESQQFPVENLNDEVKAYGDRFTGEILASLADSGIGRPVLEDLGVGFNGRYLVFPYYQQDGNCYSARCVHPERHEDFFWQGADTFCQPPFNLFNAQELLHCEQGTLFLCQGEENYLTLRQLGFPGVAVAHPGDLERLEAECFARIRTVIIVVNNELEAGQAAHSLAARIGFKARILQWPAGSRPGLSLAEMARETGKEFGDRISAMLRATRAFSPFVSPRREFASFVAGLQMQKSEEYLHLRSGYRGLDQALGGVHGINVIGGAPKVGKSTFMIQMATEMARRKIPVLYYDFENGRQKILQRTVCRLSSLATEQLGNKQLSAEESGRLEQALTEIRQMLFYLRIVNDRKLSPEIMRKHIEFLRHEAKSTFTVVVIDSLHKLPFKDFSERRTGIDAWLRQMESIRDELNVSFLVISELDRGLSGKYAEEPHLGIFKGSGDIEYSADNALVLFPSPQANSVKGDVVNRLWLVASREHSPGHVADYRQDYPFWRFVEEVAN